MNKINNSNKITISEKHLYKRIYFFHFVHVLSHYIQGALNTDKIYSSSWFKIKTSFNYLNFQ